MAKNMIGIVVGQDSYDKIYVWCLDLKNRGILPMVPQKPLKLGDWLNMKFTSSEILENGEYQVSNYEVIPEIYETEVQGGRVLVKLELYMMSNQQELDHPFFGKICNARNVSFPSGLYSLAIKRKNDVWIMEYWTTVIPKAKKSKVIGIVSAITSISGTNEKECSVWYKERESNVDVIVISENPEVAKVGTWLSMDLYLNPRCNIFECLNFTVIPTPIHPTLLSENNQLCLKLKTWVLEGSRHISHPFAGEIANTLIRLKKSGMYTLTIQRTKNGSNRAWFLKQGELLQPYHISPRDPAPVEQETVNQPNGLISQLLRMNGLAPPQPAPRKTSLQQKTNTSNNQQTPTPIPKYSLPEHQEPIQATPIPQPIARRRSSTKNSNETPARPSNLLRKTQALGSHSEASISTMGRSTQRQRSSSRPGSENPSNDLIAFLREPLNNQNIQHPAHQEPIQPTINPQVVERHRSSTRDEERGRAKSKRRISKSRQKTNEITGIVVAEDAKNFFVWCRERLPGQNITIPKTQNNSSLSLTSWVEFTVTSEQMNRFFLDEMPENGIYPRFQKDQFRNVPTKFPTYLNTQDNSISIEIKMEIHENSEVQNIRHGIFGVIINQNFVFHESGMYSIIIRNRFKNGEHPESVWYLEECKLLPPNQPPPINRHRAQNNLNLPLQPTIQARPSNLLRKTQAVGSQSEATLSTIGRPKQRQRSSSTPRIKDTNNASNPAPIANCMQNLSSTVIQSGITVALPTPTPRSSLEKKVTQIMSEAIVTSIVNINDKESIFVWIFDLKQEGRLFLNVAAEKLNLEVGKVFKSTFVNWNGKWSSRGPVKGTKDLYLTRTMIYNERKVFEILVNGEFLEEPDDEHVNCPWIPHQHFGDILDCRCLIQNHAGLQYTFWIRRCKVADNFQWVVQEQENR
ncbi:hypothetical protein B9Z55_008592 [Caenorhabditis nigoni]|uniref:Uncharacterized protein n=2 Tax=Caenorhabditis nigoni TaxID=1611254 RepID=A0A2G5UNW2_9PELO|nr:hypothetical protein B9Z55_008592 [Caenorhabditis nigoni]